MPVMNVGCVATAFEVAVASYPQRTHRAAQSRTGAEEAASEGGGARVRVWQVPDKEAAEGDQAARR